MLPCQSMTHLETISSGTNFRKLNLPSRKQKRSLVAHCLGARIDRNGGPIKLRQDARSERRGELLALTPSSLPGPKRCSFAAYLTLPEKRRSPARRGTSPARSAGTSAF